MEIRPLTELDAQSLWELRRTALQSEPRAFGESLEEHLATPVEAVADRLRSSGDENFVLGAILDSALVGMIGFYRELRPKRRHRGWIWGMYLASHCRGQGVGRQLLEGALRRAETLPGLRCVLLSVSATQNSARLLYTSFGFVLFGTEPQALQVEGRFIDEYHMVFTLKMVEIPPVTGSRLR